MTYSRTSEQQPPLGASLLAFVERLASLRGFFMFIAPSCNKSVLSVKSWKWSDKKPWEMFTEVKSIYRLYGPPMYINKMQELVDSLVAAGHSSYLAKQLAITNWVGGGASTMNWVGGGASCPLMLDPACACAARGKVIMLGVRLLGFIEFNPQEL